MKPVISAIAVLLALYGCIERVEKAPDEFDQKKVIEVCEQVIDDFQGMLKQELITAMTEGGAENAIKVCNLQAPMIADSFSTMPGFDIRRVSLRQRNLMYAPDEFEDSVLNLYASLNAAMPQVSYKLTYDSGNVRVFRYMKEIKVGQICLKCHGEPAGFSQPLKAALDTYYPEDQAVGYNVGDSRGAFSVTVRYPEARATITKILSENGK